MWMKALKDRMDRMVGIFEDSRESSGSEVWFDANASIFNTLHVTPYASSRVCLCAGPQTNTDAAQRMVAELWR